MRSFGGPSKRRRKSKSMSIHETVEMHRRLGTYKREYNITQNSLLSSAWQASKEASEKTDEEVTEDPETSNTLSLEDGDDNDKDTSLGES